MPDQANKQRELTFLAQTADVQPDCGTLVELAGRAPIAVFRLGDEFFATDDTCTHGAASLCDGEIFDGQVECPFHGGTFDIRTGAATTFPCTKPLAVYPVVVENGRIYARLDSEDGS
ncbi:non-heme iron oxygenase ferredoxin subunit [Pseudoxanthomonas spadix]|uniref:non-heme iron oxygenase ferredoxin subunit n=1 Tax=Pseudoxanthomonas spadix TaxID=415229 RepID=UPI000B55F754|nr:non-heme iron oxygenase ferredoxin subunit [Pseudoxanthomonas spadix]ART37245.1 D637 [uncultured bacterium]ART39558.1 J74 [uncultured bacterium]